MFINHIWWPVFIFLKRSTNNGKTLTIRCLWLYNKKKICWINSNCDVKCNSNMYRRMNRQYYRPLKQVRRDHCGKGKHAILNTSENNGKIKPLPCRFYTKIYLFLEQSLFDVTSLLSSMKVLSYQSQIICLIQISRLEVYRMQMINYAHLFFLLFLFFCGHLWQ